MKTKINCIGVLDQQGVTHAVPFKEGLNIVTGKSSTGKSAIIEIFDYCFGSSENTIPKGVITDCAAIYFVELEINETIIIIARDPDRNSKAFYKRGSEPILQGESISREYFDDSHFIPINSFKKRLRSDFLDIDDVDESLLAKENRGRKAPTPSIRSFTSFILQHQNLVANKHALFYRFDEQEKREQAIDHTKIFLGIVKQEYFLFKQKLELLKTEERKLRLDIKRSKEQVDQLKHRVEPLLLALYAAAGIDQPPVSIGDVLNHPQDAKERLDKVIRPDTINPLSKAHFVRFHDLEQKIAIKTSQLRQKRNRINSIEESIHRAENFFESTTAIEIVPSAQIAKSVCPFCNTLHHDLTSDASNLKTAIEKVSKDLSHTPAMTANLRSTKEQVSRELKKLISEISELMQQRDKMQQQNNDLNNKKTLYETVLKFKAELSVLLEQISMPVGGTVETQLKDIQVKIKKVEGRLKEFDVEASLKAANKAVNAIMSDIGQKFDFEESYKPINLKFSFETFDLYHQGADEKVYLRSMGSGANWLFSHITLFLALHRYFATLKNTCAIPSVLFLDQPTQVYFPSFRFDKDEEFSTDKIKQVEKRSDDDRQVDDDIKAVENLFSQLYIFCKETKEMTGIMPQIIVSDHADNLNLSNGIDFESLVNGNRWRTRGLIHHY